jgi:hypothetical protein
MPVERIDARSRNAFLEGFSGQHRGWLITVEETDVRGNRRRLISEQPLLEAHSEGDSIEISAGADNECVRKRIDGVTDLLVDRADADAIAAVRFITATGETTLRLRTVISPSLVDGAA